MKTKVSEYLNDKEELEMQSELGKELVKKALRNELELDSFVMAMYSGEKPMIIDIQTLNLLGKIGDKTREMGKEHIQSTIEKALSDSRNAARHMLHKCWSLVQ